MNKTRVIKKNEIIKNWYIIDADNVRLGRLATKCASLLLGKNKIYKASNIPSGDAVIVINAKKIDIHKTKLTKKKYYHHSGFMGGLTEKVMTDLLEKFPERIIEKAVKGMLPHTKLGDKLYKNLYVYSGNDYPHQSQKPIKIEIK